MGGVSAKIAGQLTPSIIGTIQVALFPNEGGMKAVGGNLFTASEQSGEPVITNPGEGGGGSVLQGFVETSNVNPIEEITNLIKAHRAYDMNSKMMQTADKMMAPTGSK